MPKSRDHSKRQVWLAFYLDRENRETFLNKTASARAAGFDCKSSASFRRTGRECYNACLKRINDWFEEAGWSKEKVMFKLIELMDAKEDKIFAHEGIITDVRRVDALTIQRDAVKMALSIKGMEAPKKHEVTGKDGEAMQIESEYKMPEEARVLLDDLVGEVGNLADTVEEGLEFLR